MPALAPAQPHAKFCFFGGALLVGGQSFLADLLPTYRPPPFHIVAARGGDPSLEESNPIAPAESRVGAPQRLIELHDAPR